MFDLTHETMRRADIAHMVRAQMPDKTMHRAGMMKNTSANEP
jgi:hypothetical protein